MDVRDEDRPTNFQGFFCYPSMSLAFPFVIHLILNSISSKEIISSSIKSKCYLQSKEFINIFKVGIINLKRSYNVFFNIKNINVIKTKWLFNTFQLHTTLYSNWKVIIKFWFWKNDPYELNSYKTLYEIIYIHTL